jgi:protein tyrosine phosphatase (PTP) superfamily phosphohydrolase (DUF442 family)
MHPFHPQELDAGSHEDKSVVWLRRALVGMAATTGTVVVIAGSAYLAIEHGGNLHAVEPGVFYRSAQLSVAEVHEVVQASHIKTILNLRGPNAGQPWYDGELRAAQADGVVHLDYALSALHELTPAQMRTVLELIRTAPKPILVHCNGGADRTGLVSALYEMSRGKDVATAGEQLGLRYGHFPYFGSRSIAMDRSFAAYVAAQGGSNGAAAPVASASSGAPRGPASGP